MRESLRHGSFEAQEWFSYADPNLFEVLALPVIAGDPSAALKRPDGVVLTRSTARRYFGRERPLGETLLLKLPDGPHPLTVGAIIEDLLPEATHLRSVAFVSSVASWTELHRQDEIPGNVPGSDVGFGTFNYLKLAPHADPQHLQAQMPAMAEALFRRPPQGWKVALELVRMDRLNQHPGLNPGAATRQLMTILVGAGVLVVAVINFVNLQTAPTARRAREIAIRKLAGASRGMILAQFVLESTSHVLVAVLLGIALTEWVLPWANTFLGAGATFDYWRDPALLGSLLLATLILGALTGIGPGLTLAGASPVAVLRGTSLLRGRGGRALLVTLQFAVLMGLMIASGIIYLQRQFAMQDALRVDTEQMLLVRNACRPAFVQETRKLPGVRGAACAANGFLGGPGFMTALDRRGTLQLMFYVPVEKDLLGIYGVKPLADELAPRTGAAYVLNETAARRLGFGQAAESLGFELPALGRGPDLNRATFPVIGVVPDFSLDSVERRIEAEGYLVTAMANDPEFSLLSVRLTGRQIPETLTAIDTLWHKMGDGKPLNRQFLDAHIQSLYLQLQREAQLLGVLAAIAVGLACLGLLGLAATISQRHRREIGIRKALGADTTDVLWLLLRELTRPVVWANLIAWPAAAWAMQRWLERFAYHIDLPLWLFPSAAACAGLIALLTVAAHAHKAARALPVVTLRYE